MKPAQEWMEQWTACQKQLRWPVNLEEYFTLPELTGKSLTVMKIGPCSLPTGRILVRDPLVYLGRKGQKPYFQQAPAGTFETEVCVIKPQEEDCARYAAVRLRFTDEPAVWYGEALIGTEDLNGLDAGEYFGFNVDAGLGCICDEVLYQEFCDFTDKWEQEHSEGNLYDDYFADLFAQSYQQHPDYQRAGGDWLNWQIPGTEHHLPIFQSGFGDGTYPVLWGYDRRGEICQLVVQFIDIALAYGEAK